MKVVTVDEMRRIEAESQACGISTDRLMENAGLAVAEQIRHALGELKSEHLVILVGPGNNGSDGLIAARHLDDWGARVHVYICGKRPKPDVHLRELLDRAADVREVVDESFLQGLERAMDSATIVIDAMLGTGRSRALNGVIGAACAAVKAAKDQRPFLRIMALDVPTGLDADDGSIDEATPRADATIALGYPKVGLFLFPGAAHVGHLYVADIGIPSGLDSDVGLEVASPNWVATRLPKRPISANKGIFGKVLVVAGSSNFIGAANLACAGAVRTGAGLVTLATPRSLIPAVATALPEVTYVPLPEVAWGEVDGPTAAGEILNTLPSYDSVLIGPGLGQGAGSVSMVTNIFLGLIESELPRFVIDADGLNILSSIPRWWRRFPGAVVTPHPGEMARLTGQTVREVECGRIGVSRGARDLWDTNVLLKGAYSIITGDSKTMINPFANPALATAGTGDVLGGIVASLVAQGLMGFEAAVVGAYLHGTAGEDVREVMGDAGSAASDLLKHIPPVIKRLRAIY